MKEMSSHHGVGSPSPYEIVKTGFGASVHFFEEVATTMEIARQMANDGAPHMSVVVADSQVKGRGRLTRQFISQKGGLFFTVIVKNKIPEEKPHLLNFSASLCLVRAVKSLYPIDAGVKWPNDILVGGEKLSGMISEMIVSKDFGTYVNIGIGVNVNNDPPLTNTKATSLLTLTGKKTSVRNLLFTFLNRFNDHLDGGAFNTVVSEWKKETVSIGKPVRIETTTEITEGHAVDVDDDGAMMVRMKDGFMKRVIYGDCFHPNA